MPLKLGPRGRAEGTEATTLWFADAIDDRGAELSDTSRLEEGVRRVRALAAGGLALLLPAALVGMAVAAGAAAREGESEAIERKRVLEREIGFDRRLMCFLKNLPFCFPFFATSPLFPLLKLNSQPRPPRPRPARPPRPPRTPPHARAAGTGSNAFGSRGPRRRARARGGPPRKSRCPRPARSPAT